MIEKIVKWMREYKEEALADGFVFCLTGGVDSAVLGGLAKRAAGENHIGLILPCRSPKDYVNRAKEVADILKLNVREVDLTPVLEAFLGVSVEGDNVSTGNLISRLRMAFLYHEASRYNYLVLSPINKVEYLLGYFTKYGDNAADLTPLRDLLKRDIRMMASDMGLPDSIVYRPPSADFWDGQTDESDIGLSYDILDQAITGLERGSAVVPFEAMGKVIEMNQSSEHKRQWPPKFLC